MSDDIRITVGGKLALTVAMFAAERGIQPSTVRGELVRLGLEPVAHLDHRTPLFLATAIRRAFDQRTGRGAAGRPKPRHASTG